MTDPRWDKILAYLLSRGYYTLDSNTCVQTVDKTAAPTHAVTEDKLSTNSPRSYGY